ncbi:hypothetical protein B0T24DRAFT_306629 [Lasiosphaeria ovina]|uniref:Ankyrin repeat protein n=1 Tax=Lasiosphaeria ovina TaxID=92902 RepID=A0AAE0K7V9_9PEZI|nr:hypothetical protein B0T24DRAFT_306629 [Lasiosphaeria ovina]
MMAEPLSMLAGIASLITTTTRISGALHKIHRGLKNGPELLLALSNEIADLTLVLDQTQRAQDRLGQLSSDDSTAGAAILKSQLDKAHNVLSKLDKLSADLLKRKRSLQRVKWVLHESKATTLKDEMREVRRRIHEILTANNATTSARIELQLHSVSSTISDSRPFLVQQASTLSHVSAQLTALQELQVLGRSTAELQLQISQQLSAIQGAISSLQPPRSSPVSTPADSQIQRASSLGGTKQPETSTIFPNYNNTAHRMHTVYFRATLGGSTCATTCSCRCHTMRHGARRPQVSWAMPEALRQAIGQLFIGYSGFPVGSSSTTSTTTCDSPSCRVGNQQQTIRLLVTYAFPLWFVWRTMQILFEASSASRSVQFGLVFRRRINFEMSGTIFSALTPSWGAEDLKAFLDNQHPCVTDINCDNGTSILQQLLRVPCDESRNVQKLRLLLQYGADPDSKDDRGSSFRRDLAIHKLWGWPRGMLQIEGLLSEGFVSEVIDHLCLSYLQKVIAGIYSISFSSAMQTIRSNNEAEFCHIINARDQMGQTALHFAARWGNPEAIQMLLEAGADYTARDVNGMPAPYCAAACPAKGKEKDCAECLRLFLDAGANPDEMLLLQKAAWSTNLAAVQTLLEWPGGVVDINLKAQPDGLTAFHYAIHQVDIGIARYLLERGADKNTVDSNGRSAVQLAVCSGFHEGLELLLAAHADHLHVSTTSGTILHYAAIGGNAKTMDILAGHGLGGLDPNLRNSRGRTAVDEFERRPDISDELRRAFTVLLAKLGVTYLT